MKQKEEVLGGIATMALESQKQRERQEDMKQKEEVLCGNRSAKVAFGANLPKEEPDIQTDGWHLYLRWRIDKILSNTTFDSVIGIVICINSVTVGWESQYDVDGKSTEVFDLLEPVFLIIYTGELGMRLLAHGFSCLTNG